MWILPKQIKESFLSVPECEDSKEDLNILVSNFGQSLQWKSKPLSSKTWYSKWSRVYWIRHLYGAILRPLTEDRFVEWWTASQEVTLALPSQKPENERHPLIPDTFGRMYSESLQQYDLFGASSKMSGDTLNWDMTRFTRTFAALVTQLSAEYTQRRKLAQHMRGNDSSSLQWPTATAWQSGEEVDTFEARRKRLKAKWGSKTGNGAGETLNIAVKKWTTPTLSAAKQGENDPDGKRSQTLIGQTRGQKWGTPRTSEHKGARPKGSNVQQRMKDNHYLSAQVEDTDGQPLPEGSNIRGKRPVLSPAWTAQLMGTTLERIFFAWSEMPLFTRQRPKHILTYSQNSDE